MGALHDTMLMAAIAQPGHGGHESQDAGMPTGPDLGLYEALIDRVLEQRLATDAPDFLAQRAKVDDADLPLLPAEHVGRQVAQVLRALGGIRNRREPYPIQI